MGAGMAPAPSSAFALIAARIRRRLGAAPKDGARAERVRRHFAARASELLEAPPDSLDMLEQVAGLAVPDMADLCVVDRSADPGHAEALRMQRALAPLDPHGPHPVATVARTGRAVVLPEMEDE